MKSRALLSRIAAMTGRNKTVEAEVKPEAGNVPKWALLEGALVLKDPVSGEVTGEFLTIHEAVEAGFDGLQISKAVKNGNKYKGNHWSIAG
jgi:hypothetical protein